MLVSSVEHLGYERCWYPLQGNVVLRAVGPLLFKPSSSADTLVTLKYPGEESPGSTKTLCLGTWFETLVWASALRHQLIFEVVLGFIHSLVQGDQDLVHTSRLSLFRSPRSDSTQALIPQ